VLEKILLIAALIFAVGAMLMGVGLSVQTSRLSSAQKALNQAGRDNIACRDNITHQNTLIDAYAIDIANARAEAKTLSSLIDEDTKTQKVRVVERLVKDNSCEEQLRLVEDILDEFYMHD
jgi:hypothetical protein